MTSNHSLSLCITVYKGGIFWKECWENVKVLSHYFDTILISFNKSEIQMEDVAILLAEKPENVVYFVQNNYLEPIAHHLELIKNLKTDYVFFLCHDDWLLEPGLKEIHSILNDMNGEQVAIFGAHEWSESETTHYGVTRELLAFPSGIPLKDFILSDIDNYYSFSASGTVCPVNGLKDKESMIRMFSKGFRYDNFIVTYPGIVRILQTRQPVARIRLHAEQDGQQPYPLERKLDNISYYFIQCLCGPDEEFFMHRTIDKMIQYAFSRPIKGTLTHFITLIKESGSWKISSSKYMLFGYIFFKKFVKKTFQSIRSEYHSFVRDPI